MARNPFDLTGKTALITGASRGIGESVARILAAQGAHVVVSSRKEEGCAAVADSIASAGGAASAYPCHLGELEQIQALVKHVRESRTRLDILINNAEANPYFGPILDTDLAAYTQTVDVNLRGYFFLSVEAGKLMRDRDGGNIVNISSVNGLVPGHMQGIYSITKAAVISMTKAFAKECAPFNIRVNAVLPGLTDTRLASTLTNNPHVLKPLLKAIPMGRAAKPDEIAGAVLYLASDAAPYTTGACLPVDGGLLA